MKLGQQPSSCSKACLQYACMRIHVYVQIDREIQVDSGTRDSLKYTKIFIFSVTVIDHAMEYVIIHRSEIRTPQVKPAPKMKGYMKCSIIIYGIAHELC